jgi:hypothetical protein
MIVQNVWKNIHSAIHVDPTKIKMEEEDAGEGRKRRTLRT